MKVRGFALGLLVVTIAGGSQLVACGGDEGSEPELDGGTSGNESSGAPGAPGASSGSSSGGKGASSSSSSSGSLSSSGEGGSSSGGNDDAGSSDAGESDAGEDDDGGSDAGEADAGVDAGPPSNDPFDPASCAGPAWPVADALAFLNAAPFRQLGSATVMSRTRVCPGGNVDQCGAWAEPEIHVQSLLTYSGGVTTDYKQFSFPTLLFLYAEQGVVKYSVRHTFDHAHDPNDVDHGIVFSSADAPMSNSRPRIYVWDPAPAPNRYQDLEARLGDQAALFVGAGCARYVAPRSFSEELAALYRF